MARRTLTISLFAALCAVSLTGCIFLPTLGSPSERVEGGPSDPPPSGPAELEPSDPFPSDPLESEPTETESCDTGSCEPSPSDSVPEAPDGWPAEIPLPQGTPRDGYDTADTYMVSAPRDVFEEYMEEIRSLPGAEELDINPEDFDGATFSVGDHYVIVLYTDVAGSDEGFLTVSIV